ncbi:MAG: MBL fold metallo-hydrolase [Thermoplasmata archaeon]|nr:MBL fold metallo-hydrolase [Thermoplasmata archaeon]
MSFSRPTVRIIREGYLVRTGGAVTDASSTVTMVESAGARIVVDSGSPRECGLLKDALESAGIAPGSVSHLINTHLHVDHCGCNELFEKARVYAHAYESPPVGVVRISERTRLLPGVELVPTPGHTGGSISVFVTAEKRYAICGDAIPSKGNYDSLVPPAINIDPKLALQSLKAIVGWAEVVVPGHGPPFEVLAKK